MSGDTILARILQLAVRDRHLPQNHLVVVNSPPGAGKTRYAEYVGTTLCALGVPTAIASPRFEQTLALVRRLLAAYPNQSIRLWVGKSRSLPADLARRTTSSGADWYLFRGGNGLPIDVATVSKFARLAHDHSHHYGHLICDEAYQITLADYEPLLSLADRHLLIGDPGQLPPVVKIETEPFEGLAFRVHAPAPEELLRHNPQAPVVRLPLTYRLPPDTASLVQLYYPQLPFTSAVPPAGRAIRFAHTARQGDGVDRALDLLSTGASLVVLVLPPINSGAPPVDHEAVALIGEVVERVLERQPLGPDGRRFGPRDIGCVDPHVASGDAQRREFGTRKLSTHLTMIDTAEIWQGSERAFMVVHWPSGGQVTSTGFNNEPGRHCVSLSRHQFACIVVTREPADTAFQEAAHGSGDRPLGSPDRTWQGVEAERRLWAELEEKGRLIRV